MHAPLRNLRAGCQCARSTAARCTKPDGAPAVESMCVGCCGGDVHAGSDPHQRRHFGRPSIMVPGDTCGAAGGLASRARRRRKAPSVVHSAASARRRVAAGRDVRGAMSLALTSTSVVPLRLGSGLSRLVSSLSRERTYLFAWALVPNKRAPSSSEVVSWLCNEWKGQTRRYFLLVRSHILQPAAMRRRGMTSTDAQGETRPDSCVLPQAARCANPSWAQDSTGLDLLPSLRALSE